MITERYSVKMRGSLSSLRTVQNDVQIVVTGREDLERLAKIFDDAAAASPENSAGRAASAAACRKMAALKRGKVVLRMPTAIWENIKGGAA